jgi:hypothetical protein
MEGVEWDPVLRARTFSVTVCFRGESSQHRPTIYRKLMLTLTIQLYTLNNVLTGYRFLDHSASTEGGGSLIHTANISHVKHK